MDIFAPANGNLCYAHLPVTVAPTNRSKRFASARIAVIPPQRADNTPFSDSSNLRRKRSAKQRTGEANDFRIKIAKISPNNVRGTMEASGSMWTVPFGSVHLN